MLDRSRHHVSGPLVIGLLILMALAVAIRCQTVGESLWLDELHTAWVVSGPFDEVQHRASQGNQSPLYFWVLWLLPRCAGEAETMLRLPSLLAGASLVSLLGAVTWWLTRDPLLSLIAAFCVTVDPYCILFSREARPYACLQFVALAQMLAFGIRVRSTATSARAAWIVLSWGAFYLHYTGLLLLTGELLLLGAIVAWPRRAASSSQTLAGVSLRTFITDLIVLFAGMLPSVNHVREIGARRSLWSSFVEPVSVAQVFQMFHVGVYVGIPLILVVMLRSCWRPSHRLSETNRRAHLTDLIGLSVIYLVPITLAWGATWVGIVPIFFLRYLISFAVLPILVGVGLGTLLSAGVRRWTFGMGVLLTVMIAFSPYYIPGDQPLGGPHASEDWRGAIAWINQHPDQAAWPVFVRAGLIEDDALRVAPSDELYDYCLFPVRGPYRLDETQRAVSSLPSTESWRLNEEQLGRWKSAGGGWFLLRGNREKVTEIEDALQRELHGVVDHTAARREFGRLVVIGLAAD